MEAAAAPPSTIVPCIGCLCQGAFQHQHPAHAASLLQWTLNRARHLPQCSASVIRIFTASTPALLTPTAVFIAGMSNAAASALVALYLGGGGLGGLLGGWIGDLAAQRWPNHGRIVATQFSVLVGIPFVAVIFKVRWAVWGWQPGVLQLVV